MPTGMMKLDEEMNFLRNLTSEATQPETIPTAPIEETPTTGELDMDEEMAFLRSLGEETPVDQAPKDATLPTGPAFVAKETGRRIVKDVAGGPMAALKGLKRGAKDVVAATGDIAARQLEAEESYIPTVGAESVVPKFVRRALPIGGAQGARDIEKLILQIPKLKGLREKQIAGAREWAKQWRQQPEEEQLEWAENPFSKAVSVIAEGAPLFGVAIAAAIATRSPVLPALIFGKVEGAGTYEKAREAGKSVTRAELFARMNEAWNIYSEAIPFEKALGRAGKKALTRIAQGMTTEGLQELIQGVGSNLIEKVGYDPARKMMEGWLESIVGGAGLGGLAGGVIRRGGARDAQETEAMRPEGEEVQPEGEPIRGVPEVDRAEAAPTAEAEVVEAPLSENVRYVEGPPNQTPVFLVQTGSGVATFPVEARRGEKFAAAKERQQQAAEDMAMRIKESAPPIEAPQEPARAPTKPEVTKEAQVPSKEEIAPPVAAEGVVEGAEKPVEQMTPEEQSLAEDEDMIEEVFWHASPTQKSELEPFVHVGTRAAATQRLSEFDKGVTHRVLVKNGNYVEGQDTGSSTPIDIAHEIGGIELAIDALDAFLSKVDGKTLKRISMIASAGGNPDLSVAEITDEARDRYNRLNQSPSDIVDILGDTREYMDKDASDFAADIVTEYAREHGVDGIVYENKIEDPGSVSYILFDSSLAQIMPSKEIQGIQKPEVTEKAKPPKPAERVVAPVEDATASTKEAKPKEPEVSIEKPKDVPEKTVEQAIQDGDPVKAPKGTTVIQVTDKQGRTAIVDIKDADSLKGAGPYKKAEFGVRGKKGFVAGDLATIVKGKEAAKKTRLKAEVEAKKEAKKPKEKTIESTIDDEAVKEFREQEKEAEPAEEKPRGIRPAQGQLIGEDEGGFQLVGEKGKDAEAQVRAKEQKEISQAENEKRQLKLADEADDIATKAQKEADGAAQAGYVEVPEKATGLVRRATENFFGFFRAFGAAHVSDKKLARKLDKAYHELASVAERSALTVHEILKKAGERSLKDSLSVAFALEEGTAENVPKEAKALYKAIFDLREIITKIEKEAGVLAQEFPASAKQYANDEIARIQGKEEQTSADIKKLAELETELKKLEKFTGWLPHSIVARRVIQSIYENKNNRSRRDMAERLEQFHHRRKGRGTLREYIKDGVISAEDADVGRLAADMVASANRRLAIKALADWGKDQGYITTRPSDTENYVKMEDLPAAAKVRGMEKMWVHRLFADGLQTLAGADKQANTTFDKALAISKAGQFWKGTIIWVYNVQQRIYGGAVELNPIKDTKNLIKAWRSYLTKDEYYQKCLEGPTFQEPYITGKVGTDALMDIMVRQTRSDAWKNKYGNRIRKILERATGEKMTTEAWRKKGMRAIPDVLLLPYRPIAEATWGGDRVQRMHTKLNLEGQGYSEEDAANRTADMHGAYSKLGQKYRKLMSRIFFVISFRILMPIETAKTYGRPFKMAFDAATGKSVPMHKVRNAVKALAGTVILPTIMDAFLAANGWEPVEEEKVLFTSKLRTRIPGTKYRVIWALPNWKYKKEFMWRGKKREAIVGINNIVNMGQKWLARGTKPTPHKLDAGKLKAWSLIKWELNPMYRTVIDLWDNESSFGGAPPRGTDGRDLKGGAEYAFGNIFRLYSDGYMAMAKPGKEGDVYKRTQREQLGEALTLTERIFANTFGYTYTRSSKEERVKMMYSILAREIGKAKTVARKHYDGVRLQEEINYLNRLHQKNKYEIQRVWGIAK